MPIVFILTDEKVLLFSTVNFTSLIDKKNEDDFKLWNDVFEIELDIDEFEKVLLSIKILILTPLNSIIK